jgi:hypothetical protein
MGIKTGANNTFPIGGVSYSTDSFMVVESVVLQMNIGIKKKTPIANLQNVS